jgi:hypothetical protein
VFGSRQFGRGGNATGIIFMPGFRPSGFGFCTTWRPRPFVWRPDRARTNRYLFDFDRARRRFRLASVHPGHSVPEVLDNIGFDFDRPAEAPVTQAPSAETLQLMRSTVAPVLAEVYPQFAENVFGLTSIPSS